MPKIQTTERSTRDIEHEGKKTPIKGYEWDEIDDIDVENPFDVQTVTEAKRAHTLLHWGWNDRALPGWSYNEMIAEHAKAVKFLLDRGHRHARVDSLDTTLPDDLKDQSYNPDKDLGSVRTIDYYSREKLEDAGIDTVKKLIDADAEELSEETGFDLDYINYIQERADEL